MADPALMTAKVRTYMEALSPTARAMLGRSLRASERLEGTGAVVLRAVEALEIVGEPAPAPAEDGEPWSERLERAFFAPLVPFLDDDPTALPPCRIARSLLPPIWAWIRRDLASDAWERALSADPLDAGADPAPIARKLRREVVGALVETLRSIASDPKARRRVAGQIGGEGSFLALGDVAHVLQHEAAFANLFGQLPGNLGIHDATEPSRLVDVVRSSMEQGRLGVGWIAEAVLTRTTNPCILAHLACRLSGSTDPRFVAGSRWAPLVDAVVARIDRHAVRAAGASADAAGRRAFLADLRAYHDLVRGLELAMSVDNVAAWFRRLGTARAQMSQVVSARLEAAAGLLRRSLRFDDRGSWEGGFDAELFEEAEFAVLVTLEARQAVDSLAVNEVAQRARKQVEKTLELISTRLLDELRGSRPGDRTALVAAVDGSIRLCGLVFGEEHAAILRRSRELVVPASVRSAG